MDFSKVNKSPIMLREENRRYAAVPSEKITGYIKIEYEHTKGIIIVILDNIKFFPRGEYVYKLILAGTKKEKRYYHMIGEISVNARGIGEAGFRVNPSDLDGAGSSLGDFSTAIIAAMSTVNNRESLHPVLKGSFDLPKNPSPKEENRNPQKNYNGFYNSILLRRCIELAKRQTSFADIVPFAKDPVKAAWKKITDTDSFPLLSPGAEEPLKKYGHFLWGYNDNHYFIAVPGRYFAEEQPDEGKSGFVLWEPIIGMEKDASDGSVPVEERRKNVYGYWIAAINRYNGHIEEI